MSIQFSVDPLIFESQYQEKKPLLMRGAASTANFSWRDANEILARSDASSKDFKISYFSHFSRSQPFDLVPLDTPENIHLHPKMAMKTIPFLFILRLIVPELKSTSENEIHSVIDSAKLTSKDHTKKRYRQCFVASMFVPFLVLFPIFFSLNLFSAGHRMLFVPILTAVSVYLSLLMLSVLGSVIFAPEVRRELKSNRRFRQVD